MKNELSSLIDGELDEASQQTLLLALQKEDDLRATWHEYQLIGDAIRKTPHLDIDLTARVMSSLSHEPTVLAPAAKQPPKTPGATSAFHRGLQSTLRIAAAISGVAVVGWLALNAPSATNGTPAQVTLAAATPAPAAPVPRNEAAEQAERMQPYLMAHQTYAPGSRFDGGAAYVRTVASIR